MGGGAIFSLPVAATALLTAARPRSPLLRWEPTRSAMSTLASVVSLGSPGSALTWSLDDEDGASPVAAAVLRCRLARVDSGAVVSPSSPEASRDSVCPCCSCCTAAMVSASMALVGVGPGAWAVPRLRLLLPPREELLGDDIVLVVAVWF